MAPRPPDLKFYVFLFGVLILAILWGIVLAQ